MTRRKRRHGHEAVNFWPGYVDALVNIVLNMVFLSGILVVAYFLQALGTMKLSDAEVAFLKAVKDQTSDKGQTSAKVTQAELTAFLALLHAGKISLTPSATRPTEPVPREPAPSAAPPLALPAPPAPAPDKPVPGRNPLQVFEVKATRPDSGPAPSSRPQTVVIDPQGPVTQVRIGLLGALSLDEAARLALETRYKAQWAACDCDYLVSTRAVLDDAQARRVAYLQVQMVRSTLLALGVPPQRVQTRILAETQSTQGASQVVQLEVTPHPTPSSPR